MICEGHLHVRARGSGFIDCFEEVGGGAAVERQRDSRRQKMPAKVKR